MTSRVEQLRPLGVRYYRREKIVVACNMQNVPIEWYSPLSSPFDSKEPVHIETESSNVQQLIKFLVSKTQEEMNNKGYTMKNGLEITLQTEEVRMYVGYWLEHLTTKLQHFTQGQAMSYLPHESLTTAMTEIGQRLRDNASNNVYDFTNMTNIDKERMPYIITRNGYSYKTIYYVPRQVKHLVAYQLKGDDQQIKYQEQLFDMTVKPNNSIAIMRSLNSQPAQGRRTRSILSTYEGSIPTIDKLHKKCTKIRRFYCAVDRLRPVVDICLKALILKQQDAFEKCAGKLEKGSQRVIRIALNKFQFFTKRKNVNKIVTCTKNANDYAVPETGLATIQLNNTCKKVFVNNKKFEYEPKKDSCVVNNNPCVARVADIVPNKRLRELLNMLINNPLQDSIEIITKLTTTNFWNTYKIQIILTIIIVLLLVAVGFVLFHIFKVVQCGVQSCFATRGVNTVDEHELDPLRTAASNELEQTPPALPQTVSLPLSEVQGVDYTQIMPNSNDKSPNVADNLLANTGSIVVPPPPYVL